MLLVIIMLIFGVIVIAGFMIMIGGFASGIGQVIGAKRRGDPQRVVIPPGVQKWADKQAAKNQVPIINVTVKMPPTNETPEQKSIREKMEARRRYLDSLVDR